LTLGAGKVADALTDVTRRLPATVLPDGAWFPALIDAHLARRGGGRTDRLPGETAAGRGEREIRRVARRAAIASGLAAASVTGGVLAAWLTEGLAAPIGIPAGLLAIVLDAAYTALLGIDLVCDLGVIHGVPFGDADAVAAVFADALHLDGAPGDLGRRVGKKLMARAFTRDLVPLANLAAGPGRSFRTILALGEAATRRLGHG
jgi:hypothetical protein